MLGGQLGSIDVRLLPPSFCAFFTVGIAAAANFLSLPSVSRPFGYGLLLIRCPSIARATARRAASASPVPEPISASIEIASAAVPV